MLIRIHITPVLNYYLLYGSNERRSSSPLVYGPEFYNGSQRSGSSHNSTYLDPLVLRCHISYKYNRGPDSRTSFYAAYPFDEGCFLASCNTHNRTSAVPDPEYYYSSENDRCLILLQTTSDYLPHIRPQEVRLSVSIISP